MVQINMTHHINIILPVEIAVCVPNIGYLKFS